ncbi:Hsp20/alpha crystallin family protein [Phocaeicola dorei]|nr:Hsp20/alpha crystallin family protein [Phocaeicola dorei]
MMPVRRSNQTWLPSIFNDFFDNDWMVKANATAPAINVIESDKDYKVEVAAPGMTKEDFKIHINEDNDLVISMEKKTESTEGDKEGKKEINPEKPDVPLNKNDAFQKVQKRRVQEKR